MKLVFRQSGARANDARVPLPIAEPASTGALLIGDDAQPVWPVHSVEERAALDALCEVFGAEPIATPARAGAAHDPAGTVVGIGDVAEEARLYAHLTRREWRLVDAAAELRGSPLPDVVISLGSRIDAALVEVLATAPADGPITGIVWGRTRAELGIQVLLRTAAAVLAAPRAWAFTGVLGYASGLERVASEEVEWLGGGATPEALRGAVSRGAALLTVIGHGDPMSFRLADDIVVCGVPLQPETSADPARAPLCHATGVCHKLHVPFAEATGSERFLAPATLAARVVTLICCQSAFIGSPALDAAWTVLPQLLANPRLGAIAATPDLSTLSMGEVSEHLCKPLVAGVPVGRALADYERHPAIARIGHRLILFGDPATRTGPPRSPPPLTPGGAAAPGGRTVPGPPRDRRAAELELLSTIAQYVRGDTRVEGTRTSERALDALRRHEVDPDAASAGALRRALLDHVATIRGRPEDAWMLLLAELRRAREPTPCPNCAWPVRPATTRLASGLVRVLVHCPRCANVVDRPSDATAIALQATLPRLRFDGPLPARDWAAAAYLVSEDPQLAEMQPWPADADGAPCRTIELSAASGPPRPLAVRVVLIAGLTVHAFGVPGRADRERAPSVA